MNIIINGHIMIIYIVIIICIFYSFLVLYLYKPDNYMFKNFTASDFLMLTAAFMSLIFSELLWFKGEKEAAIFIGLWVPSILGFAILLKLIKNQK